MTEEMPTKYKENLERRASEMSPELRKTYLAVAREAWERVAAYEAKGCQEFLTVKSKPTLTDLPLKDGIAVDHESLLIMLELLEIQQRHINLSINCLKLVDIVLQKN